MPYNGNPGGDARDAIRLLIGDVSTSTGSEIFADAEIDFFAASNANVYLAASAAVSSVVGTSRSTGLAGVVMKAVGDLRIEYGGGGVSEILTGKARELRMLGVRRVKPYAGGISKSDKRANRTDVDWAQGFVRVGGFDTIGWSSLGDQ